MVQVAKCRKAHGIVRKSKKGTSIPAAFQAIPLDETQARLSSDGRLKSGRM